MYVILIDVASQKNDEFRLIFKRKRKKNLVFPSIWRYWRYGFPNSGFSPALLYKAGYTW